MIIDGLTLTVIGMSVVFMFLILLVFIMKLLSFVVHKYFPEKEVLVPAAAGAGNAEIAVAIAAAAAFQKR